MHTLRNVFVLVRRGAVYSSPTRVSPQSAERLMGSCGGALFAAESGRTHFYFCLLMFCFLF